MHSHPTRRTFLKHAALLPLAAATGLPLRPANAALAPIKRAGGSHLRTSLNAYSFLELLTANSQNASKGLDLFGVCDFCAKHDFDAVDLTGYFFPGYLPIETLAMKRKGYDSFVEIPKMLAELREAIAVTESVAPQSLVK